MFYILLFQFRFQYEIVTSPEQMFMESYNVVNVTFPHFLVTAITHQEAQLMHFDESCYE